MRIFIVIVIAVIITLGLIGIFLRALPHYPNKLLVGDRVITVEIADSDKELTQGLSGRESMDQDHGMFFVFPKSEKHGIWMKDMNFPIDILWLNKLSDGSYLVVDMKKEVYPETYPEVFIPLAPSRFVLELNAGTLALSMPPEL